MLLSLFTTSPVTSLPSGMKLLPSGISPSMDFFQWELLLYSSIISPGVYLELVWSSLIQECLNGEFVRVGPNPKFDPVAGYHWHVLFSSSSSILLIQYHHHIHFTYNNTYIWNLCRFDGDGCVDCFLLRLLNYGLSSHRNIIHSCLIYNFVGWYMGYASKMGKQLMFLDMLRHHVLSRKSFLELPNSWRWATV